MQEAEYIQFSWFSREFQGKDVEQIYEELVGAASEATHRFNTVVPAKPMSSATGTRNDLNCLVQMFPQRLDFVVRNKGNGVSGPIGPLLNLDSNLSELIETVSKFSLCGIKCVDRLALIANLCESFESAGESNKRFMELCPVNLECEDVSDLLFRFNKRKKIKNICKINRIFTFNVRNIEEYIIFENGININDSEKNMSILNFILDINTVPEHGLMHEVQKDIWKGMASEIIMLKDNPSTVNGVMK